MSCPLPLKTSLQRILNVIPTDLEIKTQEKLFLLGSANSLDCSSCKRTIEDVDHALGNCPPCTDAREQFFRVARGAGNLCGSVEDVLFLRGSRRPACIVSSALLDYLGLRMVLASVFRLPFIIPLFILLIP